MNEAKKKGNPVFSVPTRITSKYAAWPKFLLSYNSLITPFRYKRPFENFGQNWDPKIGQKTSIRGFLIEISAEVIILRIIYRLVRNFDWGPSDRVFLAYFRTPILTKIFEWTFVTKRGYSLVEKNFVGRRPLIDVLGLSFTQHSIFLRKNMFFPSKLSICRCISG